MWHPPYGAWEQWSGISVHALRYCGTRKLTLHRTQTHISQNYLESFESSVCLAKKSLNPFEKQLHVSCYFSSQAWNTRLCMVLHHCDQKNVLPHWIPNGNNFYHSILPELLSYEHSHGQFFQTFATLFKEYSNCISMDDSSIEHRSYLQLKNAAFSANRQLLWCRLETLKSFIMFANLSGMNLPDAAGASIWWTPE